MYRFAQDKIKTWFKNSTKALLVSGARQVGKTYTVRKTLTELNQNFYEINFIERQEIVKALKEISDISLLENKLSLYLSIEKDNGKPVVFLDEIQEFPEIVTKIKFLVDRGTYRYILSGSMLGIELKGIHSIPVGYLEEIRMYPMSLYEFSIAMGVTENTLRHIDKCYMDKSPVDPIIHTKMLSLFHTYLIIGGMPSVVSRFLRETTLKAVQEEQENIIRFYKADFIKYETEDRKLRIISIYDNIPAQLNKQNLKFKFTFLDKELKFDRYENSFIWLSEANVSIPVYIANEAKTPLVISKARNSFKLFMSDVGLLTSTFPYSAREEIISGINEYNNGALFENFVAEELTTNGIQPYYFNSKAIGEIDFIVEIDGNVLPIEVKSGKETKRHRALDNLMNIKNYNIAGSLVLSEDNVQTDGKIVYLPIYMAGLLKKETPSNKHVDLDKFKF